MTTTPVAITAFHGQKLPYPGYATHWGFAASTALIAALPTLLFLAFKRKTGSDRPSIGSARQLRFPSSEHRRAAVARAGRRTGGRATQKARSVNGPGGPAWPVSGSGERDCEPPVSCAAGDRVLHRN
jgi:hypothetical protein